MDLKQRQELDKRLVGLSGRIQLLWHLEAINSQEERIKFLSRSKYQPKFVYREPKYSFKLLEKQLSKLKFVDDAYGHLQRRKAETTRLRHEIVKNLGNPEVVRDLSARLNKKPSNALVRKADSLCKRLSAQIKDNHNNKNHLSSEKTVKILERELRQANLHNWKVLRSRKQATSTNPSRRELKVSLYKKYTYADIKRLWVHEIFGHAFRAENGYRQPLRLFSSGIPGYLSTEEGIAMYLEDRYHSTAPEPRLRHALKVIAVDAMDQNFLFRETFDRLKAYNISDDLAWELTYRAFRGGGFYKDYVYLKGYYEVCTFVKKGGDLKRLYVGKIGIKHLEICTKLRRQGILKKPKFLPKKVVDVTR